MSDDLRAILEKAGMSVSDSAARPNWCPGARIVQTDGRERRMPCDRVVVGETGRCGPCSALERQNRLELAAHVEASREVTTVRRRGFREPSRK